MLLLTMLLLSTVDEADLTCEQIVVEYETSCWEGDGKTVAKHQDEEGLQKIGGSLLVLARREVGSASPVLTDGVFYRRLTIAAIDKMSREQAFAAYFAMLGKEGKKLGNKLRSVKVIGTVTESPDICHVVCRLAFTELGDDASEPMMYTCVRENQKWKVQMEPEKYGNYARFLKYCSQHSEKLNEPGDEPKSR